MCEFCDEERRRLMEIAEANPMPCIVCDDPNTIGAGTWIPDASKRLAAGATPDTNPVFCFCLCRIHADETPENERLITQAVLRDVQAGKNFKV